MPKYKYEIDSFRPLTPAEKDELRAVLARAWQGMQRREERHDSLAKTMHPRHLDRIEVNAIHAVEDAHGHDPKDPMLGTAVYTADETFPHLYCGDCRRTLIGYGQDGGLACLEVAAVYACDTPHGLGAACHETCVMECGEQYSG